MWTPSEFVTTSITSSPLYRNFSQQTKIVTMNTGCEVDSDSYSSLGRVLAVESFQPQAVEVRPSLAPRCPKH